ncbi:MAG: ATP-binding cassette domain-containing protein, partial [Bdellovibrionales bacterium]|nr:ATP-binding cassette domain-containing protein [Bdellovibrionales bacterium]
MNFILESNSPILEVRSLDIGFSVEQHSQFNLRDQFVSFVKGPLNSIWKTKEIHTVLKDFDLVLKKGDRLGLLGVNGTGKTSLCRTIAGMYGKRRGVTAFGEVRAIFNTEIGIIPELTGEENAHLLCSLMYPRTSKEEQKRIVEEALIFSELREFQYRPFITYS